MEDTGTVKALDRIGREIKQGDTVVRSNAWNLAGSSTLDIHTVTKVNGGKVYLDNSKMPIRRLDTLAVVVPL